MKRAIPWLVLVVLVIAAGAWYFMSRPPGDAHPSVIPVPETPPAAPEPVAAFPVERVQPQPQPAPEPLPTLADSDTAIIEALADLVGPESLGAHLVLEQVISRIVSTIDSLPSRQVAPLVLPVRPPAGEFLVSAAGEAYTIDPGNAARYQPYVQLVAAMDVETLVATYVRFYPLFQEAYAALGYPDAYFNDRLVEVIDHLLATPEADGTERLLKPEAVYVYADEALESLSAGQKLLLRIGPEQAQVIRARLVEVRAAVTRQSP